jgi:beta-N-acetylhexosaminidase
MATTDEPERARYLATTLPHLTLAQLVGQLFVPYLSGATPDAARVENEKRFGVATPREAIQKFHWGGVCYFAWADNLQNPHQIAALSNGLQTAALEGDEAQHRRGAWRRPDGAATTTRLPLTIAIDQETGLVARLGQLVTEFPGAMALGAGREPAHTREAYAITGRELRALGINANYAPVADVNVNPTNPIIGVRAFSSHPDLVTVQVVAAIEGLQSAQVAATAKHFPGHGDTSEDSHTALPVVRHGRAQWEQIAAPPFRAAIRAGVDSIMTAHIGFPAFEPSGDPATLSHAVLTGLLRDELGFPGVIATDSLRMAGVRQRYGDAEIAIRALEAGADVLLDPPQPAAQYQAVMAAVKSGRLSEDRLADSVRRILSMKYDRGVIAEPYVDASLINSRVGTADHRARAQQITDHTTTVLIDRAHLVPLPPGSVLVTGWGGTAIPVLVQKLAAADRPVSDLVTGATPTGTLIAQAVSAACRHHVTIVTTGSAVNDAGQRELVAALRETGRPLLVVALADPYDIAYLGDVPSYIACYSSTPVALESLVRVLNGDIGASGNLPVDIPRADSPHRIQYPYGSGVV